MRPLLPTPNVRAVALVITVAVPARAETPAMIAVATLIRTRAVGCGLVLAGRGMPARGVVLGRIPAAAPGWTPVVMPGWTRGVFREWIRDWTHGMIRGWTLVVVPGRARGVVPGWSQAVIAVLVRGRTRGLGRAVISFAAGRVTQAAIPVWPRGVILGWACVADGTVRVRIR